MEMYYMSTDMTLEGVVSVAMKLDPKVIQKGYVKIDGKVVKNPNHLFKFLDKCLQENFEKKGVSPVVSCGNKIVKLFNVR